MNDFFLIEHMVSTVVNLCVAALLMEWYLLGYLRLEFIGHGYFYVDF